MNRKEKLLKIIDDDEVLLPLVDEIIFLEGQLEELKKLPFLRVNPRTVHSRNRQQPQSNIRNFCSNTIIVSEY